jgi:DNA-directed RNA polymerase subunit E'/Rpb7
MDSSDLSTAEQIVQTVEEADGVTPSGDVVVSEAPAMSISVDTSDTSSIQESVPKRVQKRARPPRTAGLYNQAIISHAVQLGIQEVGRNLVGILLEKLRDTIEGRCIAEGFVKPRSLVLLTYSSGKASGSKVMFNAVFQCLICRPVEGMLIRGCVVQNITKAGIRATIKETPSPVVVFVSRDHQSDSNVFEDTSIGDIITVKVAGQRYELMDTSISVVGTVVGGSSKPTVRIPGKIA